MERMSAPVIHHTGNFSKGDSFEIGLVEAAMMKYPRLGSLTNKNLLSHGSGVYKSKMKLWAVSVSPGASRFGLQMGPSLCALARPFP